MDFGWFSCHIIMKSCVGSMAGIITNQNHRIILCLNLPHLVTASVIIRQIPIRCVYYEWIPFYHSFSWNQWAKNITKFTPCNYLLLNSKLRYYCVIDDKMELSTLKVCVLKQLLIRAFAFDVMMLFIWCDLRAHLSVISSHHFLLTEDCRWCTTA